MGSVVGIHQILLSVSQIASEFGMARPTVSKRLDAAGIKPSDKRGGHPVYRMRDVVRIFVDTPQHSGDGAEVARPFTGAGRHRRTRPRVVVEIDGEDFIAESSEEAQAILDQAKEAAEEKAKVAIERATKARNRPTRKVMADARKALELPAISAPDLGGYAEEISRQIEDIYQSAIQTIEVAALLRKRELEEEDDEDILLLIA